MITSTGPRRLFVARLRFDSLLLRAVGGGVRQADAPGDQRQLVYTTDVADILLDLQTCSTGGGLSLDGQVFPAGGGEHDALRVRLLRGETEFASTTADEVGDFAFETVPAGVYEMLLTTDRFEMLVSSLELRLA
jgi:hypothetical protein